jgi:hypothetical protein
MEPWGRTAESEYSNYFHILVVLARADNKPDLLEQRNAEVVVRKNSAPENTKGTLTPFVRCATSGSRINRELRYQA